MVVLVLVAFVMGTPKLRFRLLGCVAFCMYVSIDTAKRANNGLIPIPGYQVSYQAC